jgi:hypothetical protein
MRMSMRVSFVSLLVAVVVAAGGCVSEPIAIAPPPPPPPPDTNVYFYPAGNHANVTAEQQDRDKYECNGWAVKQSGFDPSEPHMPPHTRVQIVGGPPPGAAVGAGAVTGAVVGAAVAHPWESGRGALLGAVAGAAIGGIAEAEHADSARRAAEQASADANGARAAALERQASQFRRALSACLEARGYVVR